MVTVLTKDNLYFYNIGIQLGLLLEDEIPLVSEDLKVIRFSYIKDDIFSEVNKRTSFLSKLRSTDQVLLNMIELSKDEQSLFDPFFKEAISQISRQVQSLSRKIKPFVFNLQDDFKIELLSITVEPSFEKIGQKYYNASEKLIFEVIDVGGGDFQFDLSYAPTKGKFYSFNSKIYIFDGENMVEDFDYFDKIVFFVSKSDNYDINSLEISENNLFECLVLGVMFNWFMMSYPQEAANYDVLFKNKLSQLISSLNSSGVIKRRFTYP